MTDLRRGSRSTRLVMKRALAILARLLEGEASRDELITQVRREVDAEAYGASPADAFQTDLRLLRELRFNVRFRRSSNTYHLADQSHPALRLHLAVRELEALAAIRNAFRGLPYAEQVKGLIRRIEERLPDESQKALQREPLLSFSFAPAGDLAPHSRTLAVIERAIEKSQRLLFDYRSARRHDEPPEHHVVEPYNLEYRDGHLYFDGHDPSRQFTATYRVDRVVPGSARVLPMKFVPRGRLRRFFTVRYRLWPPAMGDTVSKRFRKQREEWQADGSVIVTGESDSIFWASKLLLRYGENCQVLEPPELVVEMRRVVREMARIYEIGPRPE